MLPPLNRRKIPALAGIYLRYGRSGAGRNRDKPLAPSAQVHPVGWGIFGGQFDLNS
jgi:hypothetical protein